MDIRFAHRSDCPALLRIYGQYMDTAITFEYTLPSQQEFCSRIDTISAEYPYLVCEEQGSIIGYAYAHRHMERAAYQWNAELSVYLSREYTSKGLGTRIYLALMELLRLQGVKTAYGCVTHPNEKSEALHQKLGFRSIGIYRSAGYKCGKWYDVQWYEKELSPHLGAPAPFRPIGALSPEAVSAVLRKYSEV